MGLTLGVGTLALSVLLPGMARNMVERTQSTVLGLDPRASDAQILGATGGAIITTLTLVLPLAGLVMVAGIAGNLISGGLVFSYRAIRFDLSRINPIAGMKRLADRQALVRLGLASAKLAILGFISWQVVGGRIPAIVDSQGSSAADIAGTCLSSIFELGLTITILLAVVALADFVIQRRRATESIKMTKEEIRQEYREQEGDPLIRGARRRRARQLAFARMMDTVPTADVVITNPTTLAVAIKYDSLTMRAPKIVAKGQRLMAERIKQLASDHKVPVVEDKPLARALFPRPVGSEIPAHLYRAVARLLVLVHQARFAVTRSRAGFAADRGRGAGSGFVARPWWGTGIRTAGTTLVGERAAADENEAGVWPERPVEIDEEPGDADVEVDEEALAAAMAADELGDLTAEEIAAFEEPEETDVADTEAAPDDTTPTDDHPTTDDHGTRGPTAEDEDHTR